MQPEQEISVTREVKHEPKYSAITSRPQLKTSALLNSDSGGQSLEMHSMHSLAAAAAEEGTSRNKQTNREAQQDAARGRWTLQFGASDARRLWRSAGRAKARAEERRGGDPDCGHARCSRSITPHPALLYCCCCFLKEKPTPQSGGFKCQVTTKQTQSEPLKRSPELKRRRAAVVKLKTSGGGGEALGAAAGICERLGINGVIHMK